MKFIPPINPAITCRACEGDIVRTLFPNNLRKVSCLNCDHKSCEIIIGKREDYIVTCPHCNDFVKHPQSSYVDESLRETIQCENKKCNKEFGLYWVEDIDNSKNYKKFLKIQKSISHFTRNDIEQFLKYKKSLNHIEDCRREIEHSLKNIYVEYQDGSDIEQSIEDIKSVMDEMNYLITGKEADDIDDDVWERDDGDDKSVEDESYRMQSVEDDSSFDDDSFERPPWSNAFDPDDYYADYDNWSYQKSYRNHYYSNTLLEEDWFNTSCEYDVCLLEAAEFMSDVEGVTYE